MRLPRATDLALATILAVASAGAVSGGTGPDTAVAAGEPSSAHPPLTPRVTDPAEFTASEPLLGDAYPLEVVTSFSAGLMHWLDSLAGLQGIGLTAGKTIEAHRFEFQHRFGDMLPVSTQHLMTYRKARLGFVARHPGDPYAMTRAFFTEEPVFVARARAASFLPEYDRMAFIQAIDHFAVQYRPIWNRGDRGRRFLAGSSPGTRGRLAAFLQQVASFLEADPAADPARVFLVPVPRGHGTHAQAIGTNLLIEVRPSENLTDQIEPIVHENVHFLYRQMPGEKLQRLEQEARRHGRRGQRFFATLREGLPTALGQGVAGRQFRRHDWSRSSPWYHRQDVDLQAKHIYPIVAEVFEAGGVFDVDLLRRLLGSNGGGSPSPVTPRSP